MRTTSASGASSKQTSPGLINNAPPLYPSEGYRQDKNFIHNAFLVLYPSEGYTIHHMRRPHTVPGTYHHVIIRGVRGMDFLHDESDRWMCLQTLYYFNDELYRKHWRRDLSPKDVKLFKRPDYWPPQDQLVSILAFCIHDNHIHLLVKEIKESGLTCFMRKVPNSISNCYKEKYEEGSGSIFQPYQSRIINSDADLRNVALYIMIKNVFERAPGGLKSAENNFEKAWKWALSDPFSSFPDYASDRKSPVINKDLLQTFFSSPTMFKEETSKYMKWRKEKEEAISELILE